MIRFITISLLCLAPLAAADKHPWAGFKPGSYAKLKTTAQMGPTKMVTEVTQTLISIDANNAVVEIESKVMGQSNKTRTTMPLKASGPAGNAQGKPPVMVNETITAAGKSLACKCVETTTTANGATTKSKACMSETVPGGAVRVTTQSTGPMKMDSVTELVEFAAK